MLGKRETKRATESMGPRMKRRQNHDHGHHGRRQRQNGEHDHHGRRYPDLLQGLGRRTARRLQPWLAAERRRLGGADGLPGAEWLPNDRPRPPRLVLKTEANPEGAPIEALDDLRAAIAADPSQLYKDWASGPFFGANRPGSDVSQGVMDAFWFQAMRAGRKNVYECIKAFSETDFTEDLKRFDVPTLIVHGDDDQIVPIVASAYRSSKLVEDATLKVYEGAPHGLPVTHRDRLNEDLLAFIKK